MHSSLGLWTSPFGGYKLRHIRIDWAKKHGYEINGYGFCLAGTKYKAALKKAMTDFTKEYNVGYFKWDGFLYTCNQLNHGHLPGIYSRETIVSAYLNMMDSVRILIPIYFEILHRIHGFLRGGCSTPIVFGCRAATLHMLRMFRV